MTPRKLALVRVDLLIDEAEGNAHKRSGGRGKLDQAMLPSKLIVVLLASSVHWSASLLQTAPHSRSVTPQCDARLLAEPQTRDVERSQPRRPKVHRGLLSSVTTTELGALTTIDREGGLKNKSRTKKHNKQRLLRLLAPGMVALLRPNAASASQAMAALPPVVGIGEIYVPKPNVALLFALLSAVSIGALLQLSGDGYSVLLRFMRSAGSFVRKDAEEKREVVMDLKQSTWDAYSGVLGSLRDRKRRVRNKFTSLFGSFDAKADDGKSTRVLRTTSELELTHLIHIRYQTRRIRRLSKLRISKSNSISSTTIR